MEDRFQFRVWKGKENRMVYNVTHLNPLLLDERINPENKHNVTMQCTGLKDKNGKLIYEGDIIQIQGDRSKAKVEYNLEKGMFLLVGKKYAPSAFMTIRKDYWEVIGNIYTNAHLLQECE